MDEQQLIDYHTDQVTWGVDDWCYYNAAHVQIKRITDGIINEVSDGLFNMSGSNLNDFCFPVTMDIKIISDDIRFYIDSIRKIEFNGLNWPRISNQFNIYWHDMRLSKLRGDNYKYEQYAKDARKFYDDLTEELRDLKMKTINDVHLLRR